MASAKSTRLLGPILVGNRRESQDKFIGDVPMRRIALDGELYNDILRIEDAVYANSIRTERVIISSTTVGRKMHPYIRLPCILWPMNIPIYHRTCCSMSDHLFVFPVYWWLLIGMR